MMKSAVTINLIDSMSAGPWIFWHNLEESLKKVATLGFDAVELFTASGTDLDAAYLRKQLDQHQLKLAAVGTGAGKVMHGLTLTDADPIIRQKAIAFISEMISFGASFGAPAIIGSMQGNVVPGSNREETMERLAQSLDILQKTASDQGVRLIYEPLNRYETNLLNSLQAGVAFLKSNNLHNVRLLADLFHMNIEEDHLPRTIMESGDFIGHVHFADSNRKPMGFGHTDMPPIATALKAMGYDGYVSAEAFPWPDPDAAATQTINAFRKFFR